MAQICAAVAQAELGNFNPDNIPDYSAYVPLYTWSLLTKSCDLMKEVAFEHNKLVGQSSNVAEVNLLHLLCAVSGYGMETFKGKYNGDTYSRKLKILVDSDGIKVYSIVREHDTKQGRVVVRNILDRRYRISTPRLHCCDWQARFKTVDTLVTGRFLTPKLFGRFYSLFKKSKDEFFFDVKEDLALIKKSAVL